MFQISGVKPRYFEFEAPDSKKTLHIEPPKLKTLNKLTKIFKMEDPTPEELAQVVAVIIGKNRERRSVQASTVMDWMDVDQISAFIGEFLGWLNDTKKSDPN